MKKTDIAVIGAGPAGLTAAVYIRRAGMGVTVFEKNTYGGQIVNTPERANFPSVKSISGFEFATGLYDQAASLGAEVEFDEIVSVKKSDTGFILEGRYGASLECNAVIIATGAQNRTMGIAAEERLTGFGISYCATCDGSFYRGKTVAVYGGGNTAVEDAIYLAGICDKVYIIHRREEFRADKSLQDQLLNLSNVEPVLPYVVKDLIYDDRLTGLLLENSRDGSTKEIKTDAVFVAIGRIPSNGPFKRLLDIDPSGYLNAGEDCITSVPGIFAAGDNRTKKVRQLTTACADGTVAALSACEFVRNNRNKG